MASTSQKVPAITSRAGPCFWRKTSDHTSYIVAMRGRCRTVNSDSRMKWLPRKPFLHLPLAWTLKEPIVNAENVLNTSMIRLLMLCSLARCPTTFMSPTDGHASHSRQFCSRWLLDRGPSWTSSGSIPSFSSQQCCCSFSGHAGCSSSLWLTKKTTFARKYKMTRKCPLIWLWNILTGYWSRFIPHIPCYA